MMEYDTPQPKRTSSIESKCRTSQSKRRRRLVLKNKSALRKLGKNSDDVKTLHVRWFTTSRTSCKLREMEPSTARFAFQAIESALQTQLRHAQLECRNYVEMYDEFRSRKHRLQDQKSLLAHARKRWYQHHQDVTVMPKHFETASLQSQENLRKRALSDETLMLRRELESMKDLAASEQLEIHELRNTISLHATLSLDRGDR